MYRPLKMCLLHMSELILRFFLSMHTAAGIAHYEHSRLVQTCVRHRRNQKKIVRCFAGWNNPYLMLAWI